MKSNWLPILAFATCLTAAHAETVRLPESGDPAFTAELPDGWTHEVLSDGSLKAFSAAHTAAITLAIVRHRGTLEELAAGALSSADGMPPDYVGTASISGYSGVVFEGQVVNGDGVHANVQLQVLRLDERHIAAVTLMTAENLDAAQTQAAGAVLKTVALTAPPPPAPEAAPPETPATPAAPETPATPPAPEAPATPPPEPPAPPPAKP